MRNSLLLSPRVGVISLGCAKNRVDTENLLGYLKCAGFEFTGDPNDADALIVNTCGFIASAKEESINTILEMAEYKKRGCCSVLAVTGCLSKRYREELKKELPEVDIFWGTSDYYELARELARQFAITGTDGRTSFSRILTTPPYSAYLRISDGCSNGCTFCIIPKIRGEMVSVPEDEIVAEAQGLCERGVTELNIIAQDTTAYGKDIYGDYTLPPLLKRISDIDGLRMMRVLYTYPDTVTGELIETIVGARAISNYLDMPIQHISDRILTAMNRRGRAEDIKRIIRYVRSISPDFVLRTSVMVGFPGETDDDFKQLMDFIQEYPFNRLGVFMYSAEEGTAAAKMPNQIPDEVKRERYDALMRRQQQISLELNRKRIGSVAEMLVTEVRPDLIIGRTYAEAPEVDGQINVHSNDGMCLCEGDYIRVKLVWAHEYDMDGVLA